MDPFLRTDPHLLLFYDKQVTSTYGADGSNEGGAFLVMRLASPQSRIHALDLILNNYAAHKTPEVAWRFHRQPRVHFHVGPAGSENSGHLFPESLATLR